MIGNFQRGCVVSESSFIHISHIYCLILCLSLFSYPLYLASAVMPWQTRGDRIPTCMVTHTHISVKQALVNWTVAQGLQHPQSTRRKIHSWFQLIPEKQRLTLRVWCAIVSQAQRAYLKYILCQVCNGTGDNSLSGLSAWDLSMGLDRQTMRDELTVFKQIVIAQH